MLTKLMRRIQGVKEIKGKVIGTTCKPGRSTYTVTFREIGGKERTFTGNFATYFNGRSIPKPMPASTATLLVTRRGKVVYAGTSL